MLLRLSMLIHASVQLCEAGVAVRDEWAHPARLGKRQCLTVMSLPDLRIKLATLGPAYPSDSEVLADDFCRRLKLSPRAPEYDRSAAQHEEHVAYRQGQAKVLLDEENGYAAGAALEDAGADRVDHARRQSLGGLVEHEELGLTGQRARDRQHLLLPATQVLAEASTSLDQVGKEFKRLADPPP